MEYKYATARDYAFADHVVKLTRGATSVKSSQHWDVIKRLAEIFATRFPNEFKEFKKSVSLIRETRANEGGYSPSKEIKYTATFPLRLMKMIKVCFPKQQFDKEFIYGIIRRLPLLRIGSK